jgi:hypothetical protein
MFAYKPGFLAIVIPCDKLTGLMPRQKVYFFFGGRPRFVP